MEGRSTSFELPPSGEDVRPPRRRRGKEDPDGEPTELLRGVVDDLVEASIGAEYKDATRSLAVDWTDVESFARPPLEAGGPTADPEASWGHRRGNGPGQRAPVVLSASISDSPPSCARSRAPRSPSWCAGWASPAVTSIPCPPSSLSSRTWRTPGCPSATCSATRATRTAIPEHWALPLRARGANLVMDLHPHDRGQGGTYQGAICFNGSLYCPSTPGGLFALEPLACGASAEEIAAHDARSAELNRYRFAVVSADDADGYSRVMCPAAAGKLRCPRRPESTTLAHNRPEILGPPEHPPVCCVQVSITVPPSVNAKTRQKHPTRVRPTGSPMPGAPRPSGPTPRSRTPPPTTSRAGVASWDSCP